MPNLDLDGPFPFTETDVRDLVRFEAPGNFALGYLSDRKFKTSLVGRADTDLPSMLIGLVGEHEKFQCFKFAYAASADAAFRKHVRNFRDFGGSDALLNTDPPTR